MGFFKKLFGDAADELKKNLEDAKNEMLSNLEEVKQDVMAGFTDSTSNSRDDDEEDDDEPKILLGDFHDGVLTIREGITELDDESLEHYKRIRKITFPASLERLDSNVIDEQERLEELDFSKVTKLKTIPDDFISGDNKVRKLIIPNGVTEVGDGFLGEAKSGAEIFVPDSVRKLGYITGNNDNDMTVYLFAANIDISDVEEDVKTLYVLSDYYGYYAKQLKECDSEARLREMPTEMMNVYGANEPKQLSETKQTTKPEPHKIIPSGVISTQNNELRDFKRKKMSDLREARDEKDRSRTPENMNKWKKVVADIEVIDTALKAGATTFGELKELAKDNASIIVEIDEIQASQLKAKQKQESQKKKEKVRVSFTINGDEGFTRITMYPLIGKECQQTLKNGVEHDRRTGAMEVSQDCIDKLSELLTEKDEQLPLEFLFAHVCTPTELIVTDEESDEEIYNDEYEIDPRYGIMSMDEAVDNYDEEEELKDYKEYLTDTAHTPDDNYISIGIAKTWDKLPESYIEGEGFVPSVIGETLKVASEDDIALLHGETGLSDSTVTFIMEIEDEFDPDKLDFINFDADYSDVSSVLQETLAADYVSMNAIMYDGKMYFAQPQNIDLGENEGDDYYDIVNHHLEGEQEIDIEPESEPKSDENASLTEDSKTESVDDNITDIVQKIKEKLQALDLSSFILYGNDYEGDREYEEVEQLGDEGLLESSSEYAINYNDSYDGNSSVYTKVRKIEIQESGVTFDIEEIYEDNDGDEESRGFHEAQTIDRILESCNRDTVKRGLENILTYLNDETLIKLNKNTENESMPEPVPEPKPEPGADVKVEVEQKEEPIENGGLFSARLEAMIAAALQDGVLTDKERELLKRRVEKEGEDWDEVEMIINARLAERQSTPQVESRVVINIAAENDKVEKPYSEKTSSIVNQESNDDVNGEGYYIQNGKKIIIPTSTKVIKEGTFEDNEHIEKVVFPSSLIKIKSNAFSGCTNLVELDFSQCLELKEIGESVFLNCGLKSIDLSRCTSLETIGETAFCGCKSLTNIVFPNSLCDLGGLAFGGNEKLSQIDLSSTKIKVLNDFFGTTGQYFLYLGTSDDMKNLKKISFPASIQEIPEKMCYGLKALESVDLSKCTQLKRICESAFACTPNLKEVLLSDSIEVMEKWALAESGNIKHINMPPLLKEMGYGVFAGSKIEAIDFSRVNLLKSIPEATFGQCGKLKSIILPSSLEEVGEYFFEGVNTVLKNIDFSKVSSLEVIPSHFLMCDSIKSITIPVGVKTIEDDAFGDMDKLEKMFLPPTLEHFGSFGYYDIDLYCFAPQLDEFEPLVDGLEPGDLLRLYVLPQYLRTYIEQRDAEGVSDKILSLQAMPDEYLYFYDN